MIYRMEEMESPAIFEAIAHPRRIAILQLLNVSPRTFSEIKHSLKITSSGNLSHHLMKLTQLITQHPNGLYEVTKHGKEALLIIEVSKHNQRKILQESYTWFSALIFYAIFLTIAYYGDTRVYWFPLLGMALCLLYYAIITIIVRRKVQKGDWFFLFRKNR